ncbi:MAG: AIM24 family protein [Lachnospiraceae bacterium]|nr:AIM24 family protein [Lachnospiraceae bacterium]
MFQNTFTAENGEGLIALTSSFPGEIRALEVQSGKGYIIQKGVYLASQPGVVLETYLQKKLAAGLFGGEGFVMSRLSGEGIVFLEIDGSVVEYDLDEGEQIVVSTGYVAAMDESCTMELLSIKGVKNVLFGGEHLFNTVVTGPGRVFLQTMPLIGVAHALRPYMPSGGDINIDTSGD